MGDGVQSGEAFLTVQGDGVENAATDAAFGEQLLAGVALRNADHILVVDMHAAGGLEGHNNTREFRKGLGVVVGALAAGFIPGVEMAQFDV